MKITPLDFRQKEFKKSFSGYNMNEVQDFLLEFASEYENLINEFNILKEEKEQLLTELNNYRAFDQKLKETLLAAQQMSEDLKAAADREAQLVIKDAKLQAEEVNRQTHTTIEKLEKDIEDLKSLKKTFKTQLTSLVESHLKMMENSAPEEVEQEERE